MYNYPQHGPHVHADARRMRMDSPDGGVEQRMHHRSPGTNPAWFSQQWESHLDEAAGAHEVLLESGLGHFGRRERLQGQRLTEPGRFCTGKMAG